MVELHSAARALPQHQLKGGRGGVITRLKKGERRGGAGGRALGRFSGRRHCRMCLSVGKTTALTPNNRGLQD